MIRYDIGTKRLICRFVIRKRIGEEVKYFQECTWEEEYQTLCNGEGKWAEFVATRFVAKQDFLAMAKQWY